MINVSSKLCFIFHFKTMLLWGSGGWLAKYLGIEELSSVP